MKKKNANRRDHFTLKVHDELTLFSARSLSTFMLPLTPAVYPNATVTPLNFEFEFILIFHKIREKNIIQNE